MLPEKSYENSRYHNKRQCESSLVSRSGFPKNQKTNIATQIPTVKVHSDGQENILKLNEVLIR